MMGIRNRRPILSVAGSCSERYLRLVDYEQLHRLAHDDPRAAWLEIVALIERGAPWDQQSDLLGDVVFSDALPELIEDVEHAFHRSSRFQRALLTAHAGLGGKAGPEMDRIDSLVQLAERRHAVIVEFEPGKRPPRLTVRQWFAVNIGGKILSHRVLERPDSRRPKPRDG